MKKLLLAGLLSGPQSLLGLEEVGASSPLPSMAVLDWLQLSSSNGQAVAVGTEVTDTG